MNRTLTVVFDEISEFTNSYGTFYGVSGLFDDESLVKANKKSRVEAQELRDTLLQLVGIECDYYLDDDGKAQTGRQKWKLKAILDAEGGAIYGKPPNVEPGRKAPAATAQGGQNRTVSPTPSPGSTSSNKDDEIRAAVALKAAVGDSAVHPSEVSLALETAEKFYTWLKSKSSPAGSAYATGDSSVNPEHQAPAGESSSAAVESSSAPLATPPAAGTSSAGVGDGEAPAPAGTKWEEKWAGMPEFNK